MNNTSTHFLCPATWLKVTMFRFLRNSLLVFIVLPHSASAQGNIQKPLLDSRQAQPARDGQKDFDFEIGRWKTHLKRLLNPLTGSTTWAEYDGTTTVRKVWDGRANLVELVVDGPAGHFEGLNLRLYNPESRQWSLNFANIKSGTMATPTIGEFIDDRGEFYAAETMNNGRAILVRFVITHIPPNTSNFEQAFSDDGGRTWEVNWVVSDTRLTDDPKPRR